IEGPQKNFTAINNNGQLAATLFDEREKAVRAFLVANGNTRDLGTLGGSFSAARDLNNSGQVVGGSLTAADEVFHAFIFTEGKMFDLNEFIDAGSRWELIEAVAINDKGRILGVGSVQGEDHTFLLTPEGTA